MAAPGTAGTKESERLQKNVEEQMNRLIQQLSDLDEMRDDMDELEYNSSRADTLEQMKEFEATLNKLVAGDVSLVSKLDAMRNAVHSYISGACRDPSITRLFASKSTSGLRSKLASLEQDLKLNRIPQDAFNSLAVEVVVALEKLGEVLSPNEQNLIERARRNLDGFVAHDDAVGTHILDSAAAKSKSR